MPGGPRRIATSLVLCVLAAGCGGEESPAATTAGQTGATTGGGGAPGACTDATDLQTDPLNCGSCGRTCVVPRADAGCVAGECTIGKCDLGWTDCDGDVETGCELEIDCNPGAACTTSCSSKGALECSNPCAPTCTVPAEACNAVDDDCDSVCDQGPIAGCRVAVHRAYNGTSGHLFTTDLAEATTWGLEAMNFFWLYVNVAGDLRPFQRCAKPNGNFFYSESNDCEMTGAPLFTMGFIAPTPPAGEEPACASVALYRIWNAGSNWHFYTTSLPEKDAAVAAGWTDQGLAGFVWTGP